MKQGLFANCYSTIHGLNVLKYIYTHTHTRTHRSGVLGFEESLSLALFCYFVTLNGGKLQVETLLSLLHTDQFTSFQQQYRLIWFTCFSVALIADLLFFLVFLFQALSLFSEKFVEVFKLFRRRALPSMISDDAKVLQAECTEAFVRQSFIGLISVHPIRCLIQSNCLCRTEAWLLFVHTLLT